MAMARYVNMTRRRVSRKGLLSVPEDDKEGAETEEKRNRNSQVVGDHQICDDRLAL